MSELRSKGALLPEEYHRGMDARTDAVVHQLTDHPSINHGLFFLAPSFRPGHPEQVAFVTHRAGHPQLAMFDFSTSRSRVLTDRDDLLPFSPVFAPDGEKVYFSTRSKTLVALDLDTLEEQDVASVPADGVGECAPSADGRWLVTAFKRSGQHGLFVADVQRGGGEVILERADRIIHPQFHPRDADLILYAGDPRPRLWTIRRDGSDDRCLYDNGPREFIVHESFLGQSDELIFAIWPRQLCRMHIEERTIRPIADLNAWHMASSRDGSRVVTDTAHPDRGLLLVDPDTGQWQTLCYPEASSQGSQWKQDHPAGDDVWASIRDQAGGDLSWMESRADTVYGPQWTHPHPAFDAEAKRVIFTSDKTGHPQVYVVEVAMGSRGRDGRERYETEREG